MSFMINFKIYKRLCHKRAISDERQQKFFATKASLTSNRIFMHVVFMSKDGLICKGH